MKKKLKSGRLSIKERAYIIEKIEKINPDQICDELGRNHYCVINYLNNQIPTWRSDYFFIHEEYIANEHQLLKSKGFADAKINMMTMTSLPTKLELEYKIEEIESIEQMGDQVKKTMLELDLFCKNAKQRIEQTINRVAIKHKQEIEDENVRMQAKNICLTRHLCYKSNMPEIPLPQITLDISYGISGIYFLWADGVVKYVGKAQDLKKRLTKHELKQEGDLISYLQFDEHLIHIYELFYIFACYPDNVRNSETNRAISFLEPLHLRST